jgi:WD40 repeat protein
LNSVVFSPDGQTVLSGSDDSTLILWEVATGEALHTFEWHESSVNSVAFSPDGQTALSGSQDGGLIWWWVLATHDDLLRWVESNWDIPELTCQQRELYVVDVQCDESGFFPTRTPFPMLPPSLTPMARG